METLQKNYILATIFTLILSIVGCGTAQKSEPLKLAENLTAEKEVPPNNSGGSGMVSLEYSKPVRELNWTINYEGLTGPVTAAHFHGPAVAGQNAGPAIPIEGNLSSPITGTAVLTAAQEKDLLAGKWYINLHTAAHPDGEIRAQISEGDKSISM